MNQSYKLYYPNGLEATFNPSSSGVSIAILATSGRLRDVSHSHDMGTKEARDFCNMLQASGWSEAPNDARAIMLDLDVTAIKDKLETAYLNGIKNPRMTVLGFSFSRAKEHSKNPGFIYIKSGPKFSDIYYGKISPNGLLSPSREFTSDVATQLSAVAEDIVGAAKAYGRATGCCSFCRRELTHSSSIALSYGPICAEHYGLPHEYESSIK